MADGTGISWTDATWNPVRGCSRVSDGCTRCYAEVQAARIVRMAKGKPSAYDGLVKLTAKGEPRWTGRVRVVPEQLAWPLTKRKPMRIFVNSMSDLFHESLDNTEIAAIFGIMGAAPQHTFQILTKRAERMLEWFEWIGGGEPAQDLVRLHADDALALAGVEMTDRLRIGMGTNAKAWPLPNVWLGVSVENQAAADERIPELLKAPAAVRFLSCEPLLGAVDVSRWMWPLHWHWDAKHKTPELAIAAGAYAEQKKQALVSAHARFLDWIIAGCESGPGARPCDVAWLRSLRDQCAAAGVAYFLKQAVGTVHDNYESRGLGASEAGAGSRRKPGGVIELPYLDGVQHAAMPATGGA